MIISFEIRHHREPVFCLTWASVFGLLLKAKQAASLQSHHVQHSSALCEKSVLRSQLVLTRGLELVFQKDWTRLEFRRINRLAFVVCFLIENIREVWSTFTSKLYYQLLFSWYSPIWSREWLRTSHGKGRGWNPGRDTFSGWRFFRFYSLFL